MLKAFGLAMILMPAAGWAQGTDFSGTVKGSTQRVIAVPDLRGSGDAQALMAEFNRTVWADIDTSGLMKLAAKTTYPSFVPQQPSDFQVPPGAPDRPPARGATPPASSSVTTGGGRWMIDWAAPPVSANYLAFGYTAVQNGVLVLYGYFYDLSQGTPARAEVISNRYLGEPDTAGAQLVAHKFAADIISKLGGKPLFGSHIYFISDRTGHKEVWMMDPDGSNQRQLTKINYMTLDPTISPDGSKFACTVFPADHQAARIYVFNTDPPRQVPFKNPVASFSAQPSFTADGKIVFSSSVDAGYRISIASADGNDIHTVSTTQSIQVEPTVNPKNPRLIAFVSDRSGTPQVYTMNADGQDTNRVTSGVGEATDPSWDPDGRTLAFAWTQGFAPGSFNIFLIDPSSGALVQLTHSEGKNEHPSWAPDGAHVAFQSNRGGSFQIWSMLASGDQPAQLTKQGNNTSPVWGH